MTASGQRSGELDLRVEDFMRVSRPCSYLPTSRGVAGGSLAVAHCGPIKNGRRAPQALRGCLVLARTPCDPRPPCGEFDCSSRTFSVMRGEGRHTER